MKTITIDCASIPDKDALHQKLMDALEFPQWYGHNLDALMDCLTDLDDIHLVCANWDMLGDWAEGFSETFADAATENPSFQFTLQ